MAFAERDGVKLFYTLDGPESAPVLMLSNSLGTTHKMWEPQLAAFSKKFRVLRYDRRGHGQSSSPPGPYSLDDLGNDALAIMDAAGASKVHWCGLSMGGMTGLWLATNHPDCIVKLVVCSAATFMPPPELWNGRIKTAQDKGIEVLAAPTMQRWFTADFIKGQQDKVAFIREQFLQTTVEGFSGCAAAMRDMDQRETVKTIKAKTLVIVGADDQGTTPAEAGIIVNRVPDARGVILKGSHIINVEAPEAFTKEVLEFLG
ncbi:3-oxoadipate enol-lactonase [Terrihabitans soli]|uniref:3-oxoadipate enol-lactonase n=1 Tax=Terrihabitans soli TaxID=708113 RepID=A0A6S6QVB2_9HYPH|nr:3-oxoadipate enol-lactonase [Terrihabitans soli]BCJ90930.1 3-oxoadipate enol-lactonase [Terrihabitans soli]